MSRLEVLCKGLSNTDCSKFEICSLKNNQCVPAEKERENMNMCVYETDKSKCVSDPNCMLFGKGLTTLLAEKKPIDPVTKYISEKLDGKFCFFKMISDEKLCVFLDNDDCLTNQNCKWLDKTNSLMEFGKLDKNSVDSEIYNNLGKLININNGLCINKKGIEETIEKRHETAPNMVATQTTTTQNVANVQASSIQTTTPSETKVEPKVQLPLSPLMNIELKDQWFPDNKLVIKTIKDVLFPKI